MGGGGGINRKDPKIIEYQEKSENYMAQKLKLFFCSSFLVSLAFH